jgi:predicted dehydrogenase
MSEEHETPSSQRQRPLRVGLVGVTGYAFAYFEEINKLADEGLVEWGAVTIINQQDAPEQVAYFKAAKVPIYDDYLKMLDGESGNLDWVCVPTAIQWHARMTIDALRRGMPVLLEKPIAPTLQDVAAIQAEEKASGKVVAIGFQHNYGDSTWEIKRRLVNGDIGEIRRIEAICLWPRARSYYSRNHWGGRIFVNDSWVLDSPLHNAISHVVNLILFFAGPVLETRADLRRVKAELYRSKPIQNYDTVRTVATLDTGAKAGIVLSHSSKGSVDPEIRIEGSKGTLTWRFNGPHTIEKADGVETLESDNQLEVRERMFRNILQRILGDTSARICTTEQAKGEVKWVNASQDAVAIHEIPPQYVFLRESADGNQFDTIDGVDEIALKAYRDSRWFKELDVPWAVEPGEIDLENYTVFKALKTPSPVAASR